MKVYFSPASPFVRKVMVCAHELGIADRVQPLKSAAHPINRDAEIRAHNPLGQVPTLFDEQGEAFYDSRVICEYLDAQAGGHLFGTGAARWRALREQALGDGALGAALIARYETVARPEALRWPDWIAAQLSKAGDVVALMEGEVDAYGERADIGTITLGCMLGYLDFRFADYDWRKGHPKTAAWFARFSERPSMKATFPSN